MRQGLVAVLALAALIVAAAPASAAVNNGLIKDCADDGRVDGSYSRSDLRDTLGGLPVDIDEYTSCRSAINGALNRLGVGTSGSRSLVTIRLPRCGHGRRGEVFELRKGRRWARVRTGRCGRRMRPQGEIQGVVLAGPAGGRLVRVGFSRPAPSGHYRWTLRRGGGIVAAGRLRVARYGNVYVIYRRAGFTG